ncbi:MAG: glycogen/starch synthase [Bacteroidaceae bacterium]|nr:glycogen/starch synthase [Bacteroidaceae bacterium]
MSQDNLLPDYIFESSWEVCNKVGGIYTVLSTRAKTLQDALPDRVIFIGPDFWQDKANPLFVEDKRLWADWRRAAAKEALSIRIGRWQIPGHPVVVLVDFQPFYAQKNDIYGSLWNDFQVDSLHAYGDYDEASMFSYAAGRVVESYYHHFLDETKHVVYQAHEWMTGLGALYIHKHVPAIATIFTTHATTIGRSIAGNGKPLYDYLFAYNGNQMADELNVQSKHSIERQTAHHVDCFTTVSDVTARECLELLDKQPDVVLPNGFEMDFVPKGVTFVNRRRKARRRILDVANALMGASLGDETLIISTSGRYEWKNKGIDVYLEALVRTLHDDRLQRPVLALVEVPAWQAGPRRDLQERIKSSSFNTQTALPNPFITHDLHEPGSDMVTQTLLRCGVTNRESSRVKIMFVPCYLDGADGIFNLHYYDLLLGLDLTVYPSYYEPWGYTPLESVAFKVPCITTTLAGFGLWANETKAEAVSKHKRGAKTEMAVNGRIEGGTSCYLDRDGVEVILRSDYNYDEVADRIRDEIIGFSELSPKEVEVARKAAASMAEKAQWKHFIKYYYEAYDVALRRAAARNQ